MAVQNKRVNVKPNIYILLNSLNTRCRVQCEIPDQTMRGLECHTNKVE